MLIFSSFNAFFLLIGLWARNLVSLNQKELGMSKSVGVSRGSCQEKMLHEAIMYATELSAQNLINYARHLVDDEKDFPRATVGPTFECRRTLLEHALEVGEYLDDKIKAARFIMSAISFLHIPLQVKSIQDWQIAIKKWEDYEVMRSKGKK